MTTHPSSACVACRVSIGGIVQGVGFRPFVYRLALRHDITGWVLNDADGVDIHAEGTSLALEAFLEDLRSHAPPAARISQLAVQECAPEGAAEFSIRTSGIAPRPTVRISPDLATCDDCLAELRDPGNERFAYPYINCTNCGPRYSILHGLPYDRVRTTMASWDLCETCQRQFADPADRRYHAQPIACPRCGPSYRLLEGETTHEPFTVALRRTVEMLQGGRIVATKGLGGYHLACDARNAAAVEALRSRKYRKEKPFALLARDLAEAADLIEITPEHERLLADVARPIVLARAKVALPGVAPESDRLGVMLPSAGLHTMLFDAGAPSPLVMTSGNRSNEPIAYRDDDAMRRLTGIADAILVGERPIARRVDDSVVAVRRGEPLMVRRARGFAPAVVCRLPTNSPTLACGSDLKSAITLVVEGEALVSQHIGDLGDVETNAAFEETVRDLLAMYHIELEQLTIVHDLHPEFVSTRFARSLPARRCLAVQHHHAHIASVLAEQGLFDERVVGVALDGTGYGLDGGIWGGEVFVGSLRGGFDRVAWMRPALMPGGDAAARWPLQCAAAFLGQIPGLPELSKAPFEFPVRYRHARSMIEKRVRCFRSTSLGRLFDAVAALLGFTREITFEGQAAMWLENLAEQCRPQVAYEFADLDFRPLLLEIINDRLAGRAEAEIAYAFHAAVAQEVAVQVVRYCQLQKLSTVVLSGGVFQNELLCQLLIDDLARQAYPIRVLFNHRVPANDGGISLGQAALAAVDSPAVQLSDAGTRSLP